MTSEHGTKPSGWQWSTDGEVLTSAMGGGSSNISNDNVANMISASQSCLVWGHMVWETHLDSFEGKGQFRGSRDWDDGEACF